MTLVDDAVGDAHVDGEAGDGVVGVVGDDLVTDGPGP